MMLKISRLLRLLGSCLLFCLITFPSLALSQDKITLISGVSPSYKNGLQQQFIEHLTAHEHIELQLKYAPFARRLHQLRTGQIDFLVGLSYSKDREKDIYFLKPYYVQPIGIFTLKGTDQRIAQRQNLKNFRIGTITNSKLFPEIDQDENKIEIASIDRMIKLLLSGRIDGFIHNQKGGMMKVIEAQATDSIKVSELLPPVNDDLYIGISKKSALYNDQATINLFKARQKDYAQVRAKYYKVTPKPPR